MAHPRPLVLMTADIRDVQGFSWHAAMTTYVDAVAQVTQATPVIVPAGKPVDMQGLLSVAHGVVATGSRTNVHPSLFGAAESVDYEPYDVARDAMSLPLLKRAVEMGLPVLAICRGMQELNVALGGTLETEIQRKDGRLDHRAPDGNDHDMRYGLRHTISLSPGGCLANILGGLEIEVNSLHRQAIDRLAPSLLVDATAPDGVIEAVRGNQAGGYLLGVQWHPEYWAQTDGPSRRIFESFGAAPLCE